MASTDERGVTLAALSSGPHRRYNVLTDSWVLCSPGRTQRPWQGVQGATTRGDDGPEHDAKCFLCPGNTRANGSSNPAYTGVWVFTNDFPALRPQFPDASAVAAVGRADYAGGAATALAGMGELFQVQLAEGTCRVICYAPQHSQAMCRMDAAQIGAIVDEWVRQCLELTSPPLSFRCVQIFENRGEGASSPHPHGQIWASRHVPGEIELRRRAFARYARAHDGRCSLCDYAAAEAAAPLQRVVVADNEHWLAVVPFWAYWPFEVMLTPRRHVAALTELTAAERAALAALLRVVTTAYEGVFADWFPYSMGVLQRPFNNNDDDNNDDDAFHLHILFYPPLVRPAVKKFRVGFEMFADPCRDFTPEDAAQRLRSVVAEQSAPSS